MCMYVLKIKSYGKPRIFVQFQRDHIDIGSLFKKKPMNDVVCVLNRLQMQFKRLKCIIN